MGSVEDLGIKWGIGRNKLSFVTEKGGLWERIGNFERKQSFVGQKKAWWEIRHTMEEIQHTMTLWAPSLQ